MAKKAWIQKSFEGGWATDLKVGIKNSQAFTQGLDHRRSPSQLTVLPGMTREDANIVDDLVQNEVMTSSGVSYSLGSAGNVYRRSTAGVWSNIGNIGSNGYFGLDYRQDQDSLYLCGSNSVSLLNPISNSPALTEGYYGTSQSLYNNSSLAGFNVNANQSASNLSTAILTTFNETNPQKRYFQSDIEPLGSIAPYITNKGSGDWTLTLHDGLNNVLGTVTILNANLVNNQFNLFTFASQVRINVAATNNTSGTNSGGAQTYHFHLTSTVADGTVSSTANNDLSTCDMQLWADRMVISQNGMHPMTTFQQFICIGNERYLSVWEPLGDPNPSNTEWQRHRLVFPPFYQVCGITVFNEFLAIACEQITNNSTTVQDGIIFFWDGLSSTYNFFTQIPEGAPYGIQAHKNALYYFSSGNWYTISGPQATPTKIRKFADNDNIYTTASTTTVINPYASTVRKGNLLMAYPSKTTNPILQYGVYSWGSVDNNWPDSFGYNYILSTGSQNYSSSNNLQIGMVQNFGDLLHVSWRDDLNGGYGVDAVYNTSLPAPYSTWNSLIFDNGYTGKQKEADYMEATWLPLPNGVTVVLKYQINRGGWIYSNGSTPTSVNGYTNTNTWLDGDGYARLDIGESTQPSRFNELQIGIDIYCSSTTSPTITSASFVFDDLNQEQLQ